MSGWNGQTDRGGDREGGGRLMEEESGGGTEGGMEGKEGGWMRVMEVNRKGWTAWCMDITHMGLRGAGEGGGGPHRSTAPQRTLTSWLATVLSVTHQPRLQEDGWF